MLAPGFLAVHMENEPACDFLCHSGIPAVFTVSQDPWRIRSDCDYLPSLFLSYLSSLTQGII